MPDKMTAATSEYSRRKKLALCFAASFAVMLSGGLFVPGEWYAALSKPTWNPPNWVFGPAWLILYCMMAVAAWRVWCTPPAPGRRTALQLHGVQLVLNAAWSALFFGLKSPGAALIEVALLDIAVALTLWRFYRIDRTAGWMMAPYLAWLSFATALNAAVWWLNR
jgi:tryptophan-rich sensory protein